ncbi:MAG: CopG family antitoxin [Armatimonadota bacterium]|nr:CopG family antitoxin [Armatimonadota bacterium]
MAKKKYLPDFESEEEELKFWETARVEDYEWEPVEDIVWDIKPEKKKRVTLRLEPSLIAEVKALAEQLDMPYQTLTRGLIRRGLHQVKEAQRARQK